MKIIDAHHHTWDRTVFPYSWMDDPHPVGDISDLKKNYLIEFVSANPTGPLHVGHCRGAILGDVISNILKFNQHKVSKEYYVNDYGNQILSFTKSVYLRIRESSPA